jgi:site-specific recombinase XerD
MPQPRKHEHWFIDGKEGYIRGRGPGSVKRAYMRFGDKDIALGFPFIPANKRRGLSLLRAEQERRQAVRYASRFGMTLPEQLRSDENERGRPTTLHSLIATYKHEHFAHFTETKVDWYERALAFYITKEVAWDGASQKQRRAAYDALKKMLSEANNGMRVGDDTKSKFYDYVGRIFDWMVAEEWLDKNPMRALPKAARKRKSTKMRWTPEEVQKILKELVKEKNPAYYLATQMMCTSGMRNCEVLSLTRKDARQDSFSITAKGETRNVPVKAIPGFREILDRLLALPTPTRRAEFLFAEESDANWRNAFNRAVKRAKIEPGERTLYCCRKSAIWWMEHTLLWDRQDICDVVGHDEDTDDKYYRDKPTAEDLEDRIRRRTGTTGTKQPKRKNARSLPVTPRRKSTSKPLQTHR